MSTDSNVPIGALVNPLNYFLFLSGLFFGGDEGATFFGLAQILRFDVRTVGRTTHSSIRLLIMSSNSPSAEEITFPSMRRFSLTRFFLWTTSAFSLLTAFLQSSLRCSSFMFHIRVSARRVLDVFLVCLSMFSLQMVVVLLAQLQRLSLLHQFWLQIRSSRSCSRTMSHQFGGIKSLLFLSLHYLGNFLLK